MPFVIRTLCQNVAARAQADALNTTGIDARTGEPEGGTRTKMAYGGLFKEATLTRGRQMEKTS